MLPITLLGQNSISGIISDAESGETIPNAVVLIKGSTVGTTSNLDGHFTLLNITKSNIIEVRYLGYENFTAALDTIDLNQIFEIQLSTGSRKLEEIVIQGEKDQMVRMSENISQVSISPIQVQALPGIGEKDIFRSFQLLPGISGTSESSSGLFVRGGTPDQNLITFDGFTVYHVDHFYGFFSAFNSNAIKDVQLYKGGFEAKFGGRISSVMEVTGKSGNTNGLGIQGGISPISSNLTIEAPLFNGKGSFLIAGRRSYTDIIQSKLFDDINGLFQSEPESDGGGLAPVNDLFLRNQNDPVFYFYDLNAKLTFRPSRKDVISLSFYNGQDNLDNSREVDDETFGDAIIGRFNDVGLTPVGEGVAESIDLFNHTDDILKWGNYGTSLKWSRQWSKRFYTNSVAAYSNYFSRRDLLSATSLSVNDTTININVSTLEDNDLKEYMFRWDGEYLVNESNSLEFGFQLSSNRVRYDFILNDSTTIIGRDDKGFVGSAYIQDKLKLGRLEVNAGIRLNQFDVTEEVYVEPRLSAVYRLSDKLRLKSAWGIYHQFVNRIVREDISTGSRDFWLIADDQLNPVSKATHYVAGIAYETDGWLFDIEGFYKDMSGLSEFSLRFSGAISNNNGQQDLNLSANQLFFSGTGIAKGLEFLAQKKIGKYTGWAGYTLSQVEHNFPGLNDGVFYALHDQRHELKLVSKVEIGRWDLASTFVYGSGKPYTAPVGSYQIELLDGSVGNFISIGDKNTFRLPSYQRLDISATFNFELGKVDTSLGLSVFNFLGHQNIWYKEFQVITGEIIETDVNYLGFIPSVFINFKF